MANLDLPAILTGTEADLVIVNAEIVSLNALLADEHLSDEEHQEVRELLAVYETWRHVLRGMQTKAQELEALGYPTFPSGELTIEMKAHILAVLEIEEKIIVAEQEAVGRLFDVIPEIASGTIDFAEPIEKQ